MRLPRQHIRSLGYSLVALLFCWLCLFNGTSVRLSAALRTVGHVYVLNNDLSGSNSITTFARAANGSLSPLGTTAIGGLGSVAAFADGAQGSLILAHDDGPRLFAADAGSNQISVLNIHGDHLALVGVFASGGTGPISLSERASLLYVLNAANGSTAPANVAGFRVDDAGRLHPIAGATRPLSAAHPNPAQVQIAPSGKVLLVTEKGTNLIDLYRIRADGSLSGPTSVPSVGAVPFGMAFSPVASNELVVSDAAGGANGTGAATPYRLAEGTLHPRSGPVPDFQVAPCWMVITHDGDFAYTSDADSHAITGYRIATNGTISLLNANGATAATPSDTFPLEQAFGGSQFLYVLESRLLLSPPGPATLGGYQIHGDGSLTSVVSPATIALPFSAIGLAAA